MTYTVQPQFFLLFPIISSLCQVSHSARPKSIWQSLPRAIATIRKRRKGGCYASSHQRRLAPTVGLGELLAFCAELRYISGLGSRWAPSFLRWAKKDFWALFYRWAPILFALSWEGFQGSDFGERLVYLRWAEKDFWALFFRWAPSLFALSWEGFRGSVL